MKTNWFFYYLLLPFSVIVAVIVTLMYAAGLVRD